MKKIKTILVTIKNNITFNKAILTIIALGIWCLVFQNSKIISISQEVKRVAVIGGEVEILGGVRVDNKVDVEVKNDVLDVNLQEINGRRDVFFNNPSRGDNHRYYRIPVITN
ncbi:hypothetical protein [Capnocytophaga genosp. AHN8471]|uniref:hypothetical protein n=1 Tax=Capnocytophaga genosp. AHN8471 TaxID=327574 RepID=UPI001932491B|nr:hypothetical protein [Capnocytophaga genosp. AHN8471]MBM0659435.1 hypothetical protein [Capnocytophaga genosp. AHN8471]